MTISLNVLEHLGMNLYSSVPAVLTEAVANAWDADASRVEIQLDRDAEIIRIEDDGVGMSLEHVNERFLTVGYRRRSQQPGTTPKGRQPMGRKGIGKLSLLSIATRLRVRTRKAGEEAQAFEIDVEEMRRSIESGDPEYSPRPISAEELDAHGTRIELRGLKRDIVARSTQMLRRRLARRFSILGSDGFELIVDGEVVTPADRGYYPKVKQVWTYGDHKAICRPFDDDVEHIRRDQPANADAPKVRGWIGAVRESKDLKDALTGSEDESDNLNRIAIMIRGRMAQEDVLGDFGEKALFASYLVGELHVDELDEDDRDDPTTSSRQSIVEDDERFVALKAFVKAELKEVRTAWSASRSKTVEKQAGGDPVLREWLEALDPRRRKRAIAWFGKIDQISTESEAEKRHLWKHAVIAFEFYESKQRMDELDDIPAGDPGIERMLQVFREGDILEESLYGQIVAQRLAVIEQLQKLVDSNALEAVLQEFLFKHLWLLDPSWERASGTEYMERQVKTAFAAIDAELPEEEKNGRVDIGWQKTSSSHVIVELKRASVKISSIELIRQLQKYENALKRILDHTGEPPLEITLVSVTGERPKDLTDRLTADGATRLLDAARVRSTTYGTLLEQAHRAYKEYMQEVRERNEVMKVIASIDDYAD